MAPTRARMRSKRASASLMRGPAPEGSAASVTSETIARPPRAGHVPCLGVFPSRLGGSHSPSVRAWRVRDRTRSGRVWQKSAKPTVALDFIEMRASHPAKSLRGSSVAAALLLGLLAFVWTANSSGLISSNDGSHLALARALGLRGEASIDPDRALTLEVDL